MTVKVENNIGEPEGGIVKCYSCIAHGRILLELLGRPSSVGLRLEPLAHGHDIGVHKEKGNITITFYHAPKSE